VTTAQTSVSQLQNEIATLKAQAGSVGAAADGLNGRIVAMEQGRAMYYEDLAQIVSLAGQKVTLSSVGHGGSSVAVSGAASSEDDIFNYARALRSGGRFSRVWINSIEGSAGAYNFQLSLTK
jgi:Tfp pilus assembly protein PilN